jgi:hypothetical protein
MIEGHLLIGSRWENDGATDSGGVYQYALPSREFVRKLSNPFPHLNDSFGSALSSDGLYAFIGSSFDDEVSIDGGGVHIFDLKTGTKVHSLYSPTPVNSGHFGNSISISGNSLFIAARGERIPVPDVPGTTVSAGKVHQIEIGTWNLIRSYSNPDPQNQDYFGQNIFAYGDMLAVGAHLDDNAGKDSGEVYLFDTLNGDLLHTIRTVSDFPIGARFGISVALSDELLAVAAIDDDQLGEKAGATYIYDKMTGEHLRTIFDPNPRAGRQFGGARFFGEFLLIGGAASGSSSRYGEAFLFNPLSGLHLHTFVSPDPEQGDYFGSALASQDNLIGITAWGQNNLSGAVHFYQIDPGECIAPTQTATPPPTVTPSPTTAPGTSIVAGYVISSSDFSPLAEAALSLDGKIAFPNEEGRFVFHNIHAGTHELQAVSPGFEPFLQFMSFGQSNAILVELNPRGTNPNADFNFDGTVDANDLLEMSRNWKNRFPGHILSERAFPSSSEMIDRLNANLKEFLENQQ